MIDSVIKNIVKRLGCSLVIRKGELTNLAREHRRSRNLAYQALYLLRKKGLIYDWGDYVINVPILLICGYRDGNYDTEILVKTLVENGFGRDEAKSIVKDVLSRYRKRLSSFVEALYEHYILWKSLVNYLEHYPELRDEIQQMFKCLLGLFIYEAKYVAKVKRPGQKNFRKLWYNMAGIRLFAKDLASIPVSKDILRGLGRTGRDLISSIELISSDENRLVQYHSKLFLKYTLVTVFTRDLLNNSCRPSRGKSRSKLSTKP